jgi:hypothetical protein
VLRGCGSASHLRDRATSHESSLALWCPTPLASALAPVCSAHVA